MAYFTSPPFNHLARQSSLSSLFSESCHVIRKTDVCVSPNPSYFRSPLLLPLPTLPYIHAPVATRK
jgi:hypothetical protein